MGSGLDNPSTRYHLTDESFDGGENYCKKAKRKNQKKTTSIACKTKMLTTRLKTLELKA